MSVALIAKSYHVVPAVISYAVAAYSAFLMVEIVRRIRAADRDIGVGWLIGGTLCVGTGVWAEHFIGLLSLDLPIKLGFNASITFLSWCPAVLVMGIVIALLSRPHLPWRWRAVGVTAISGGVYGMHYLGVASMGITPAIAWDWSHVWQSAVLAVVGATSASVALRSVLDSPHELTFARKLLAAVPCAIVLRSVQWAVLSAAGFPEGAQSTTADQLSGAALADLVAAATLQLFVVARMTYALEQRMQMQNDRLAGTLKRVHNELESTVYRDALTQLANRQGFEHQLGVSTQCCDEFNEHIAVMFVNLDGFKVVNDSFGHSVGDALLQQAATRLSQLIRHDDLLARAAGDEFLLMLRGTQSTDAARQLAQRISESMNHTFALDGHEIVLSCSIGIALYPQNGPASMLMPHAAAAMQAVKRAGGAGLSFFEPGMLEGCASQIDLQRDLRHAITAKQLMLYFQPKLYACNGQIAGVEALLRWKHPDRGMVSPVEFIPVAERFGLIGALGNWVIDEACRQIRCWLDQGLRVPVAINLSVHQLRQPDLEVRIRQALIDHQVDPRLLICEITESVAMENTQASMRVFEQLAAIGVQLSIDDFGTGYSSLSYLRKLPASQLKIDRSFVQDLDKSADARAIVEAVVRLAHALDLDVVAEGVETRAQQCVLLELGCDELQGFLFARPMPAAALVEWVQGEYNGDVPSSDLFVETPVVS